MLAWHGGTPGVAQCSRAGGTRDLNMVGWLCPSQICCSRISCPSSKDSLTTLLTRQFPGQGLPGRWHTAYRHERLGA